MLVIETHPTRVLAERARNAYVRAQEVVDSVLEKAFGEAIQPKAEDVYYVDRDGSLFAVIYEDPSLDQDLPPRDMTAEEEDACEARDESSLLMDCGS